MKDTHTEHCCRKHGCKYGDEDCSVEMKIVEQSFPCEYCSEESEYYSDLDAYDAYVKLTKLLLFFREHPSLEDAMYNILDELWKNHLSKEEQNLLNKLKWRESNECC